MDEQFQTAGESQNVPSQPGEFGVGGIISNGFSLGFKNLFPLLGGYILWAITIWIPYINVGTTVGLYGLVVKMSRGERFGVGEIFNKRYRRIFPEFFLLLGLAWTAISLGIFFVFIPGCIIALVWYLSYYFFIDKEMGIIESLKISNKATYGYKWEIFGGQFIIFLIFFVLFIIVWLIFHSTPEEFSDLGAVSFFVGFYNLGFWGWLFTIIIWMVYSAVAMGADGYIYRELSKKV